MSNCAECQYHPVNEKWTGGTQPTDNQQTHYAILREIMEGLKSAMRKKDGSVFFQASVSSESWEVIVGAKQHNA